jgi:hypothetical protein
MMVCTCMNDYSLVWSPVLTLLSAVRSRNFAFCHNVCAFRTVSTTNSDHFPEYCLRIFLSNGRVVCRSQWPRGVRWESLVDCLLGLWVRILSIPVAERSYANVCGPSLAGIAVSNPAGCMDVFSVVSVVCCEVSALHSSGGVLPKVI